MTRLRRVLILSAIAVVSCYASPALAGAQDAVNDRGMEAPAHVAFVDGAAVLERDGQPDASPLNMPLLAGDRVRTQAGRVEILFGDGSILHLDTHTVVDFQSDELVRLLNGRVRLTIPGSRRPVSYRIDAPWASAQIARSGEYRLSIGAGERGDEIEFAVIRGEGELVNDNGRTPLRAGERAFARANAAPSYAYVYNSAAWDAFDQWSEARRDERLGVSTQYLPEDVRPYAASFDRYGAWQYEASYGYVWYPRVAVGWRPYYNGRWATLRPYGWTWIGADPWAWPTHHYGRWGFSAGVWFWIPGRSWGPAWVSWAYAPGYVSWCPLGWNNRPVIQIVNVYNRGYDPWRAWTVVPQRHFNSGYVNVRTAGRFDLDAHTRTAFSQGTRAPAFAGYAVPRAAAPIRTAGTGRRSVTSPLYTNLGPGDSRVGRAPSRTIVGPSAVPRDSAPASVSRPNGARSSESRGARDASPARAAQDSAAFPGRSAPVPPDRSGYGRVERAPSRSAVPRDERGTPSGGAYGRDMGVGGGVPAEPSGAPARSYERPGREPRGEPPVAPWTGRAMPRGSGDAPTYRPVPRDSGDAPVYRPVPRDPGDAPAYRPAPREPGDAPGYRPAPREPRAPQSAPPRASAPEPRSPSRAPSAERPSGPPPSRNPGHARPGGAAPSGQARPRGGRG